MGLYLMVEEIKTSEVITAPIESNNLVDKAVQAADRIETALKKQEELAARMENLLAKQMLGGRAEAGLPTPKPKTDDEIGKEWADAIVKRFR
jgi:hypothetical protein